MKKLFLTVATAVILAACSPVHATSPSPTHPVDLTYLECSTIRTC